MQQARRRGPSIWALYAPAAARFENPVWWRTAGPMSPCTSFCREEEVANNFAISYLQENDDGWLGSERSVPRLRTPANPRARCALPRPPRRKVGKRLLASSLVSSVERDPAMKLACNIEALPIRLRGVRVRRYRRGKTFRFVFGINSTASGRAVSRPLAWADFVCVPAVTAHGVCLLHVIMYPGRRNGLALFRDRAALSKANVYAARREPRTPGTARAGLALQAYLLPHDPLEEGEGLRLVRLCREQVRPGLNPGDHQLEPGKT